MMTTLNIPDDLLKQVQSHADRAGSGLNDAVADLLRIGLAVSTETTPDESTLERRRALVEEFVTGERGVELAGYEQARAADRRKEAERAKAWRG